VQTALFKGPVGTSL